MKISKASAVRQDWDRVKSWNYKLKSLPGYQSVVYAELRGDHGEVHTNDLERVYYIVDGQGEFSFLGKTIAVKKDDVITVPAHTNYDYKPIENTVLKVLLFMELWDN